LPNGAIIHTVNALVRKVLMFVVKSFVPTKKDEKKWVFLVIFYLPVKLLKLRASYELLSDVRELMDCIGLKRKFLYENCQKNRERFRENVKSVISKFILLCTICVKIFLK
jgi:hypothetical protein